MPNSAQLLTPRPYRAPKLADFSPDEVQLLHSLASLSANLRWLQEKELLGQKPSKPVRKVKVDVNGTSAVAHALSGTKG